jgi:hypothetical protein
VISAKRIQNAAWRRHESGWIFAAATTTVFAIVQLVGHMHHEMWRDELHCWAVARNATGLWDLLIGERRYDGHPFLWYYLLHLASRVSRSSGTAQVVAGSLSVTLAFLWLRFAPVPRVLRVLLLASYYTLYEYGVMTRSYTLGVALTFAFCALYHPYRVRYVSLATLLALLSATSVYGTVFSIALGFFLFADGPRVDRSERIDGRRTVITLPDGWGPGLVVLGLGIGLTAITTWPPSDDAYAQPMLRYIGVAVVRGAFAHYWRAMFPFGGLTEWNWLGQDCLFGRSALIALPWFGALWWVLCLIALRRSPRVMVTYALGTLGMAACQHVIYPGGWRHIGHYFILWVACIWLYAKQTRCRAPDGLLHGLFAAGLVVQAVTGVAAFGTDYRRVFSPATEAAHYIREHHLEDRPIVADPDDQTSPVAIALDRPVLYAGSGETTDLPLARSRRTSASVPEVLEHARRLAKVSGGGRALIVVAYDLPAEATPGLVTTLLYRAGAGIIDDECIRVYDAKLQ